MEPSTLRLTQPWHSCRPQPRPTSTSTSCRTLSSNSEYRMALYAMGHRRSQIRHTRPNLLCLRRDQEERQICTERRLVKRLVPSRHRGPKHPNRPHMVLASIAISTAHTQCKLRHHITIYNMAAQATLALRRSCKTNTSIRKQCPSVCKRYPHRHSLHQQHLTMDPKSHHHNPTTEAAWTRRRMVVTHISRECHMEASHRNISRRHQDLATMEFKATHQ